MHGTTYRARTAGFTLIELLVALTILALAMGVAASTLMRGSSGFDVRQARGEVADLLRSARLEALATGRPALIDFESETRQFRRSGGGGVTLPEGVDATVASSQRAGQGRIVFYQNGTSSGGEIAIFNDRLRETMLVDWLTGSVTDAEADA